MPTSRFENDFLDMDAEEFFRLIPQFLSERFLGAEIRQEAIQRLLQDCVALLPEELQEEEPRLLPLKEFLETIGDPPEAIAEDILPAKKLIAFSGAAKEGKSLVALEILENVAQGEPLFGMTDIKRKGAVAYLGMEDGGFEIKNRLLSRGVEEVENYYISWQSFDMKTPLGWQKYLKLLAPIVDKLSLVVIDTAREAFRGIRDWNDAAVVGPIISTLRRWAQKNCTVLLITHNNKDKFAEGVNKIAGSGALISSCDGYMILENQTILDNGDLQWTLETGGRSVKRSKRFLKMDTTTLRVRELTDDAVNAAKQAAKNAEKDVSKKRILEQLSDVQGKTARDIADACGMTPDWVTRLMKELLSDGQVLRAGTTRIEGSKRPVQLFILPNNCTNNKQTESTPPGSKSSPFNNSAEKEAKTRVDDFMEEDAKEGADDDGEEEFAEEEF